MRPPAFVEELASLLWRMSSILVHAAGMVMPVTKSDRARYEKNPESGGPPGPLATAFALPKKAPGNRTALANPGTFENRLFRCWLLPRAN